MDECVNEYYVTLVDIFNFIVLYSKNIYNIFFF
jgi:hypothetical protein